MEKQVICPNCLGTQDVFSLANDAMERCPFCKGEGTVEESKADLFDPIDSEEFMYDEDIDNNSMNELDYE